MKLPSAQMMEESSSGLDSDPPVGKKAKYGRVAAKKQAQQRVHSEVTFRFSVSSDKSFFHCNIYNHTFYL